VDRWDGEKTNPGLMETQPDGQKKSGYFSTI